MTSNSQNQQTTTKNTLEEHSAGAVVYRKEKDKILILLVQSKKGEWGLPKGHVEQGENDSQAAVREVYEETGMPITLHHGWQTSICYNIKGGKKHVVFFLGEAKQEQTKINTQELNDVVWKTAEEAIQTVNFDDIKKVIQDTIPHIKRK